MFLSLWGCSIRFNTPMLFVHGVSADVRHRWLDGPPAGLHYSDLHLHESYYVIAHFPLYCRAGAIFALFAGIYFWYPKITAG